MPNKTHLEWDASAKAASAKADPGPICGSATCVKVTDNGDRVEFTSTISPDRGLASYDRAEVAQFVADAKAGRYDRYLAFLPANA